MKASFQRASFTRLLDKKQAECSESSWRWRCYSSKSFAAYTTSTATSSCTLTQTTARKTRYPSSTLQRNIRRRERERREADGDERSAAPYSSMYRTGGTLQLEIWRLILTRKQHAYKQRSRHNFETQTKMSKDSEKKKFGVARNFVARRTLPR